MSRTPARRRRAIEITASCLTATTALLAQPSTAHAAAPTPVEIVATPNNGPGFAGSWVSSGAISDNGTFERTGIHFSGSVDHSPQVGTFQVELRFTSTKGTITIRDQLLATQDGLHGTWQIESGTGAYRTFTGHGTSTFDPATATTDFSGVSAAQPANLDGANQ